jgi:hypothetical protein
MIASRVADSPRGGRAEGSIDPDNWLSLAATPTFVSMALLTSLTGNPTGSLCAPGPSGWLSEMTLMYVLMSLFHSPPWLRLARRLRKHTRIKTAPTWGLLKGATDETHAER